MMALLGGRDGDIYRYLDFDQIADYQCVAV